MEKVLIITYFYPPCNLTASARPAAWSEYLHCFGYYPIVITRNWDIPINNSNDMSKVTGKEEQMQVTETGTVYYLPYRPSLKDRLYARYGENKFTSLRKALSFTELFMQNFFLKAIPFHNFYDKAVALIEGDNSIRKVILTVNPWVVFFIGYRLKKKFPHIKWIADYRDDWNTTELIRNRTLLQKIIFRLESHSEKKWVSTASFVTSISRHYVNKISSFTGVKGDVLRNGFADDFLKKIKSAERNDEFIITYNGTLYETQPLEIFLDGYKRLINAYASRIKIMLRLPGLAFHPGSKERLQRAMKGFEHYMQITVRVPQQEVMDIQNGSHALLMIAHERARGVPSSKLYEYICFRKPVILCPPDDDIIQETLEDVGVAIICRSPDEVFEKLSGMIEQLLQNGKLNWPVNEDRLMEYARSKQVAKLAEILNSLQA